MTTLPGTMKSSSALGAVAAQRCRVELHAVLRGRRGRRPPGRAGRPARRRRRPRARPRRRRAPPRPPAGATFSPRDLMMSSRRPTKYRKPSSSLPEEVAGAQHALPRPAAGAQPLRRRLRVVPVALHDVVAADDQLADLAGRQPARRRSSSIHASVPGDRDADRRRAGRRAARAAGSRRACTRSARTSSSSARAAGRRARTAASVATGQRRAGVREEAQVRQLALGEAAQRRCSTWKTVGTPGRPVIALALEQLARRGRGTRSRARARASRRRARTSAAGRGRSRSDSGRTQRTRSSALQPEVLDDRAGDEAHVAVRERRRPSARRSSPTCR